MPRFVETVDDVDIGLLRRRGLFDTVAVSTTEIEFADGTAEFEYHPIHARLFVLDTDYAGRDRCSTIRVEFAKLKLGLRPFFVCPLNGRRCSKLYRVDGRLGSQAGHGLSFLSKSSRDEDKVLGRTFRLAGRIDGGRREGGRAR